jgi:hypothetical protein
MSPVAQLILRRVAAASVAALIALTLYPAAASAHPSHDDWKRGRVVCRWIPGHWERDRFRGHWESGHYVCRRIPRGYGHGRWDDDRRHGPWRDHEVR